MTGKEAVKRNLGEKKKKKVLSVFLSMEFTEVNILAHTPVIPDDEVLLKMVSRIEDTFLKMYGHIQKWQYNYRKTLLARSSTNKHQGTFLVQSVK